MAALGKISGEDVASWIVGDRLAGKLFGEKKRFSVHGIVSDGDGRPLPDYRVQVIFHQAVTTKVRGEDTTSLIGRYHVSLEVKPHFSEYTKPKISVIVFSKENNQPLHQEETVLNGVFPSIYGVTCDVQVPIKNLAPPQERVDLPKYLQEKFGPLAKWVTIQNAEDKTWEIRNLGFRVWAGFDVLGKPVFAWAGGQEGRKWNLYRFYPCGYHSTDEKVRCSRDIVYVKPAQSVAFKASCLPYTSNDENAAWEAIRLRLEALKAQSEEEEKSYTVIYAQN